MADMKTLNGHSFIDATLRIAFESLKRKVLAMSGGLYHLRRDLDNYRLCQVIRTDANGIVIKLLRSGHTIYLRNDASEGNCAITELNGYAFNFDSVFNSKTPKTVTLHKLIIDGVEYDSLGVLQPKREDGIVTFSNAQIVSHGTPNSQGDSGTCVTVVNITSDGFSVYENRGAANGFIQNKVDTNGIQEIATVGDMFMFSLDNGSGNPPVFVTETVRANVSADGSVSSVFKRFSFEGVE